MTEDDKRRKRRGRPANAPDRESRRAELIDAAITVIRRIGVDASMDDIAAEAGISKPILYSHFGDKAGLADAVGDVVGADLVRAIAAAQQDVSDPRTVISVSIDAFVAFVENDPKLYRFLTNTAFAVGPEMFQQRLIADLGAQIARLLGETLRSQKADSGGAEPWAFGLLGMVHLATEWWVERQTMSRADLVSYLTALLWSGFDGNGLGTARLSPPSDQPASTATPAPRAPTKRAPTKRAPTKRAPS